MNFSLASKSFTGSPVWPWERQQRCRASETPAHYKQRQQRHALWRVPETRPWRARHRGGGLTYRSLCPAMQDEGLRPGWLRRRVRHQSHAQAARIVNATAGETARAVGNVLRGGIASVNDRKRDRKAHTTWRRFASCVPCSPLAAMRARASAATVILRIVFVILVVSGALGQRLSQLLMGFASCDATDDDRSALLAASGP